MLFMFTLIVTMAGASFTVYSVIIGSELERLRLQIIAVL